MVLGKVRDGVTKPRQRGMIRLAAGSGPYDPKRLRARRDRVRQWGVR